jgi:hypothetical protein
MNGDIIEISIVISIIMWCIILTELDNYFEDKRLKGDKLK